MDRDEMLQLFEAHREAEAARDLDAILDTFVDDCFLETVPLGLRGEGKTAARAAYESSASAARASRRRCGRSAASSARCSGRVPIRPFPTSTSWPP